VLGVSNQLHEGRFHLSRRVDLSEATGQFQGAFNTFSATFATTLFVFDITGRFGALELTFGARASRRFGARPRTRSLLTQRSTVRFRGNTSGVTLGRGTDSLAFRARVFLAHVFRATNRAFRLLTVNRAFSTFRLLALHLAFGTRAHRVANRRARRVIALPATSRVAVFLATTFRVDFGVHFRGDSRDDQHKEH
jgi:hypothetical protein